MASCRSVAVGKYIYRSNILCALQKVLRCLSAGGLAVVGGQMLPPQIQPQALHVAGRKQRPVIASEKFTVSVSFLMPLSCTVW